MACYQQVGRIGVEAMSRRHSWLFVIWVIIGLVVAWERSYITLFVIKIALSALLAIFLWPLVLVGVSLHIH